jgi:hypothetical protein
MRQVGTLRCGGLTLGGLLLRFDALLFKVCYFVQTGVGQDFVVSRRRYSIACSNIYAADGCAWAVRAKFGAGTACDVRRFFGELYRMAPTLCGTTSCIAETFRWLIWYLGLHRTKSLRYCLPAIDLGSKKCRSVVRSAAKTLPKRQVAILRLSANINRKASLQMIARSS